MKANVATLILLAVVVLRLLTHVNDVQWNACKICAALVAAAATILLVVARIELGASFSITAKARRLVTTGLYAKIRNPIYVFSTFALLGMAVVLDSGVLAAFVFIVLPVQWLRVRREEAVLLAAFGEEYARYKAQTWF